MKNKWTNGLLILAAALLAVNGCFTALLWARQPGAAAEGAVYEGDVPFDETEYEADPLTAVAHKVLERQTVPDPYINALADEALQLKVLDYNSQTASLRLHAQRKTLAALQDCFGLTVTASNYLQQPEVCLIVDRIAQYSLYENPVQLIQADPELCQMLAMEPAKSSEAWLDFIANGTGLSHLQPADTIPYGLPDAQAYSELTNAIVAACGADRQMIAQKIRSRQVVPSAYFALADGSLQANIQRYNEITAQFKLAYTSYFLSSVDLLFGLTDKGWEEAGQFNFFKRPPEIKTTLPRLTHYILYRTYADQIKNNRMLSPLILQSPPDNPLNEPERLWWAGPAGHTLDEFDAYCLMADDIITTLAQ